MRLIIALLLVASSASSSFAQATVKPLSKGEEAILKALKGKDRIQNLGEILVGDGYVGKTGYFQVNQVIDENTALVTLGRGDYLMRGNPTKGMVDDRSYELEGKIIAIIETDSYVTVTGAKRTVAVIDVVDFKDVKLALASLNREARLRDWPGTGNAFFVEMKSGKVTLQLPTGQQKEVDSSSLESADREWIRKQIASEQEQAKKIKAVFGWK